MKKQILVSVLALVLLLTATISGNSQSTGGEIKTGTLLKRVKEDGVDNYAYATFNFAFGGNGPDVQRRSGNNWDILFGNTPDSDAFDVTMVTDDCSRIKDLGKLGWGDTFKVPILAAHRKPMREPSVKAIEGHLYLVRTCDMNTDRYALFRVEKLDPGKSVDISWKTIPSPAER